MRATLLALVLGPLLRSQGTEEHAFVELAVVRSTCFVQELVPICLRIGYDAAFFARAAIQPFQVRLDLPVQVQVPWLQKPPAGLRLLAPAANGSVSFVLDEAPGTAVPAGERMVGGRKFTVVEVERRCVLEAPGELVLQAPVLRYAYATRFEDTLLHGRVPADRQEGMVRGTELRLNVLPLPLPGRPPEFSGGVGTFRIAASVDRRELAVSETLRLQLRIEGAGNLAACTPPVLAWDGFLLHGPLEDQGPQHRTFTWDLVPLREDLREVPAIRLAFFDPTPEAGYRTLATEPVSLKVRPLPAGASLPVTANETAGVPGVDDLFDLKPVASPVGGSLRLSSILVLGALVLPWLLAFGLLAWSRTRERDRSDPLGVAARAAHAVFHSAIARPAAAPVDAFATYVAARLRCPPAAVVGPQLGARLKTAGIPAELAAQVVTLLRELGAQRFGGSAVADARTRVQASANALEAAFAQKEGQA